jgi:hypothetical protein
MIMEAPTPRKFQSLEFTLRDNLPKQGGGPGGRGFILHPTIHTSAPVLYLIIYDKGVGEVLQNICNLSASLRAEHLSIKTST